MVKISHHGKLRMRERANVHGKNQDDFFRNALRKGVCADNMKDSSAKYFLRSKEKCNCKVKLYKGYVFIYSKNNKQLYTMYKLPDNVKGGTNDDIK